MSGGKGRSAALAAGLLAFQLTGCQIGGVDETPLSGPEPSAVLVLPPLDRTNVPGRNLQGVAAGADVAVRERGYRALPLDVGFDLARKRHLDAEPVEGDMRRLQRLQREAGVDAVLVVDVAVWDLEGDRHLQSATWDVRWQLLGTADGGALWSHRDQGTWHRELPARMDPTQAADAEPPTLPFGTLRQRDYRTGIELAAALNRAAMARLPRRSQ